MKNTTESRRIKNRKARLSMRKYPRYKVLLLNTETHEERWVQENYPWEEHSEYMWVDGNMSCDCNRHLCFEHAGGRRDSDELRDEAKCGDDKYNLIGFEFPDGERLVP